MTKETRVQEVREWGAQRMDTMRYMPNGWKRGRRNGRSRKGEILRKGLTKETSRKRGKRMIMTQRRKTKCSST